MWKSPKINKATQAGGLEENSQRDFFRYKTVIFCGGGQSSHTHVFDSHTKTVDLNSHTTIKTKHTENLHT